jgi:hypothetical protein
MSHRSRLLCENRVQTIFSMGMFRNWYVFVAVGLAAAVAWPKPGPQANAGVSAAPPLVLAGGTVVDLSDWGHSARDLENAIVIIRDGRITDVGPAASLPIPKDARVIDCSGKFIVPGLIDGFAGMNSQAQANANLYMGVTTVVARSDLRHGVADYSANPRPHLYGIDSIGATDNWSLLAHDPAWAARLREGARVVELSPQDTSQQLDDTLRLGTRVIFLGHEITAANTQWIVSRAHQLGLIAYGEFVSTPYRVGVEAGVDALIHMARYDLGVIPKELERPLIDDPEGSAANTAYDYSERLPPTDPHVREYAHFLADHHAALMPTFSISYAQLPGHRNLWMEPVASLFTPAQLFDPTDPVTGELTYPLSPWTRHLPAAGQRYLEENARKRNDQDAMRMWLINETIFAAFPHYLAGSGAPVSGAMPGISLHTELEMLVRLGLSSREALAAATSNYSMQFGWNELGLIAPGRRADVLILSADPTANIWNARHISTVILDGNVIDHDELLKLKK